MKFVKLDCTRGGLKNPILKIGKGEDEITLEEAETLIAERMAVEYFPDVLDGSADAELKLANAKVEELEGKVAELQGQLDLLDPKPTAKSK